ncbi:hypothetical protein BTI_222 [Burkholderia thailandensis MSMB121]|uniref:hypothetical protein n=1 Tax=Burkholderia humptydooensis TaxID=430531 RepID=UPI000328049C|nr:hypothetical protein [Burkholderia humptydooensis]AGK47418.1 hypothetical protein BTI_222 [Burkholderia thailandensis MSMB121]ATF35462.1 hypothetical protein CO709_20110 [Burkholderia thailandensis]
MNSEQLAYNVLSRITLTWAALTIEARLLIAIALAAIGVAFRSNRRRAQLHRQRELDPIKRAIYNPKQFRRPRQR